MISLAARHRPRACNSLSHPAQLKEPMPQSSGTSVNLTSKSSGAVSFFPALFFAGFFVTSPFKPVASSASSWLCLTTGFRSYETLLETDLPLFCRRFQTLLCSALHSRRHKYQARTLGTIRTHDQASATSSSLFRANKDYRLFPTTVQK